MRKIHALCCGAAALVGSSVAMADHCNFVYDFGLGTPGPAVATGSNFVSMFRPSDVGSPGTTKLYVGGSFDTIGGVAGTASIATWDGTSFAQVGGGLFLIDMVAGSPVYRSCQVNAAVEFNGALYIGGQFDGDGTGVVSRGVIRWNGTAYESVNLKDVDVGAYTVWALAVYKGELYAGGNFPNMGTGGGISIAKYVPGTNDWVDVGASALGVGSNVFDLQVYNDGVSEKLYACGNFVSIGGVAGTKHIAAFDGTAWSSVGGGYITSGGSSYARDLVVFDDGTGPALYAAGGLVVVDPTLTPSSVNRWNGKSWKAIPGFLDNPSVASATVNSIGLYNDGTGTTILVQVRLFGGGVGTPLIMRLENGRFKEVAGSGIGTASGSTTQSIQEMLQYDDGSGSKLFVGGTFTDINGTPANRILTITGCTPVGNACPADFNASGTLEVADIFDFLNAWFAGCP
ncbi:MAG TPA: hypothetical protein PKE29_10415 [Phycisphaerales bacterium]|nr:hypothetical protein [Phycisphaerales bacterium]